jgi:regulator of protease activity HflC (stomatin/prohibitin superfamily)
MSGNEFQNRRGGFPNSRIPPEMARWLSLARRRLWWSPLLLLPFAVIYAALGILNVDTKKAAILIRKTGALPPDGSLVAARPGEKGIVLDPLPEGFYWRNPYTWDWVVIDQVEIPQGKLGVVIRQHGADLDPGEIIAKEGQKGILEVPLRPGRHLLNTLVHDVVVREAVQVPAGFVGVVTQLSGPESKNPNRFVVDAGEKGVQSQTVPPGTYYPNPFVQRIDAVDMRAHRFDMEGEDAILFPSSDGFPISLVGTIEWYIENPRVAEVFVKYGDADSDLIEAVVEEVILPNARAFSRIEGSKHLARDFITGDTRQKFQDAFLEGLKMSCAKQGVVIKSALVRDTLPPQEIANPIRQREIAIRQRDKYLLEKDREIQQKQLSMETTLMDRKTKVKDAETLVSVAVTKARENMQVALIEANRKLEVAKLELKAAEDQASALKEKGRAEADVILFDNKAKAAGLKAAREAFKTGAAYVQYVYNRKIAPALTYVLSNTDGPFADLFRGFAGSAPAAGRKDAGKSND